MRKRDETPAGKALRNAAKELLDLQFQREIDVAAANDDTRTKAISLALDCEMWIGKLAHLYGCHHRWKEMPRMVRGNQPIDAKILAILEKLAKELASIEFDASKPRQGVLL